MLWLSYRIYVDKQGHINKVRNIGSEIKSELQGTDTTLQATVIFVNLLRWANVGAMRLKSRPVQSRMRQE
jgi:hypothetical protein